MLQGVLEPSWLSLVGKIYKVVISYSLSFPTSKEKKLLVTYLVYKKSWCFHV